MNRSTKPPPSSPAAGALGSRLLTGNELAGFQAQAEPTFGTGARTWLTGEQTPAGQLASETGRLRRLGFAAGGSEDLENFASHLAGVSIVEEVSLARGA